MKAKLLFSGLLLAALCLFSCSESDDKSGGINSNGDISLDTKVINSELDGGYYFVALKSKSAWAAKADQDWVSVTPSSGKGDADVLITVTPGSSAAIANVVFRNASGSVKLQIGRGVKVDEPIDPDPSTNPSTEPSTEPEVEPQPLEGALSGKFSVGANKKIRFSKGNLQYKPGSGTYRFALNQYDFVGDEYEGNVFEGGSKCSNRRISSTYGGWIDLFVWGSGGDPATSSTDPSSFPSFKEWNVNNNWRTMTLDDWTYLLYTRPNAVNLRGQATVNGVRGYVIMPDGWATPSGVNFTPEPGNWTDNDYSVGQWNTLASKGAVFLPCGGYRSGLSVDFAGSNGCYWTTDESGSTGQYAYCFKFTSTDSSFKPYFKTWASSVRLVNDL